MPSRLIAVAVALIVLTGCDRYIEQVTIHEDGSADIVVEAEVICTDEYAIEVWGGDPCGFIDALAEERTASPGPFGLSEFTIVDVDLIEVEGDSGRRSIRVESSREIDEVSTIIGGTVEVEEIDEFTTRATFAGGGPFPIAQGVQMGAPDSWAVGEFRVVAPHRVIEHNGDRIVGRTVIWLVDVDELEPGRLTMTWSSEERDLTVWWLVVAAAVLGIVLTMIVLIEGPRAEAARTERKPGPAPFDPEEPAKRRRV